MKKILMIGTGGTIASEATGDGLSPGLTPEQLMAYVPAVSGICEVRCLPLFSIDSSDMTPAHWVAIARAVRENYELADGFVITHGTDTMAYTAAALSYLIRSSPKPVILTGAQKPIGFESTDSKVNLLDAFRCASADGISGVNIVFNGSVILGTRARKTRSKSLQAFSSINYPDVATLQDGVIMQYIRQDCADGPFFSDRLDPAVALLKLIPGMDYSILEYLLRRSDAVLIESFGVGGLPSWGGRSADPILRRAAEDGKFIVMTTQVQNEGSNLSVYQVGHRLKGMRNLLEAYDMTTESALAKIMWILGGTKDPEEVSARFYRPVANDILYHAAP